MRYARGLRCLGVLAAAGLLAACVPERSVRVEPVDAPPRTAAGPQRPAPAPLPRAGEYQVVRGDTLYGIAFRHGLDYREVARRNGIQPPYTIYPGQVLQLGERAAARAAGDPGPSRPARPASGGVIASTERSAASAPTRVETPTAPVPAQPAASAPPAPAPSAPAPSTAANTPTPTASPVQAPAALPKGPVRWAWPANGQIVGTFLAGDPTRQGIGIAGSNGQPVQAAADGVVVYSGAGLIGYGELVIVKHSEEWLSAYGHNRKRLVAEGEAVRAGQTIAEMGRSGASRDMLHFEIRRNGKPVDPLPLLPRR